MRSRHISKGVLVFLVLISLGLAAAVWARNKPVAKANTGRAAIVSLRLTFADGQWAEVSQFAGEMIRIEDAGKTVGITPHVVDQNSGTVELQMYRITESAGRENLETLGTFRVSKTAAKINGDLGPLSVQVHENGKVAALQSGTTNGKGCCATDCTGRKICGFCVCTACGACGPCLCVPM